MISFRLLGHMSIDSGGTLAYANGSKMWTIAAMLALEPRAVVPIERIVDEVWQSDPPASAIANVRTYVSSLRRLLGPAATRLIGHRVGYRLDLSPTELDVPEFERLIACGRAAYGRDDASLCARTLEQALAMFPGPALLGVRPGAALAGMVGLLEEERLGAIEDLYAAELSLGQHAALVASLRRHVALHPLRERAWAQLMTALYRCGDMAAALGAFGHARTMLVAELGIEPSPQLIALHQAMLRRSADLDLPIQMTDRTRVANPHDPSRARQAAAERPMPPRLPRVSSWFVGRDVEIARVCRAVERPGDGMVAVVLHGPAGVGTSALAIAAAGQLADRYPDGHVYVDLRDPATTTRRDVARHLLAAMGQPVEGDDLLARLRATLAIRRCLVVLDNVTGIKQVARLLPATGPGAVLIAGHRVMTAIDARHMQVTPLAPADGVALVRAAIGAVRVDRQPNAAEELVDLCDRLPLAILAAIEQLLHDPDRTLTDLVERLRNERSRLAELDAGGASLRGRLDADLARLHVTRNGRRSVQLFAEFGRRDVSGVNVLDVARWMNTSTADAEAMVARLVAIHLLEADGRGRYELTPLIRIFATEVAVDTRYALTGADHVLRPRVPPESDRGVFPAHG